MTRAYGRPPWKAFGRCSRSNRSPQPSAPRSAASTSPTTWTTRSSRRSARCSSSGRSCSSATSTDWIATGTSPSAGASATSRSTRSRRRTRTQPEVFVIPAGGTFRAPDNWHSDVTWRPEPSLGSILRAGRAAAARRRHALGRHGQGLRPARRRDQGAHRRPEGDARLRLGVRSRPTGRGAGEDAGEHPTVEHPIVRTHPETGRKHALRERQLHPVDRRHGRRGGRDRSCAASTGSRRSSMCSAASAGGPARSPSGTTAPPSTSSRTTSSRPSG